jgi:hypothetical protein
MKNLSLAFIFCFNLAFLQENLKVTKDYYCQFDLKQSEKFLFKITNNIEFNFPTFDLDEKFLPSNDLSSFKTYENYKINKNKKVRIIKKYVKYNWQNERKMHAKIIFNENGDILRYEERNGEIIMNFYYDSSNNQIRRERIVNNDTMFVNTFKYNKNNQIIEFNGIGFKKNERIASRKSIVEFDNKNRPIFLYNIENDDAKKTLKAIKYNGNQVIIEHYFNDLPSGTEEKYFSSDLLLIAEKFSDNNVFKCYQNNDFDIKTIRIKNKNIILSINSYDIQGNPIFLAYGGIDKTSQKFSDWKNTYDENNHLVKVEFKSEISGVNGVETYDIDYFN